MSNSTLSMIAYYEGKGPFAVDRARARDIFDASLHIVGQHLGPIAVSCFKGMGLWLPGNTLDLNNRVDIERLTLPSSAPFVSILTRRLVVHGDGSKSSGGTAALRRDSHQAVEYSRIITSVLPEAEDPDNLKTVDTLVHEYGHGLGGLKHCQAPDCIMEDGKTAPLENPALRQGVNPFCDECTIDLKTVRHRKEADAL